MGRLRSYSGAAGTWTLDYQQKTSSGGQPYALLQALATSAKPPQGAASTRLTELDGWGLPRSVTLGGGSLEALKVVPSYDAHGNLATLRWADGATWRYAWDDLGQLLQIETPAAGTVTFTYDDAGRLVRRRHDGEIRAYVYDDAGRLTTVEDGDGRALLRYRYDGYDSAALDACKLSTEAPSAQTAKGRLVGATRESGSTAVETLWLRDGAGRVTAEATRWRGPMPSRAAPLQRCRRARRHRLPRR